MNAKIGFEERANARVGSELMASVVVFLVALPLCMGIAIASGVPPALGLITGIVGGLVVGWFAGSPLQVSGPAAGLVVICFEIIQDYGLVGLGAAVMLAGALQLAAGSLGLGRWFRAVSPAVIYGMLAGIGVLIFASQFHVMLDDKPHSEGLENLATIPEAIVGLFPLDGSPHQWAGTIGVLTIVCIVGWTYFRPKALNVVPGALVGVVVATVVANALGLPIKYVDVPSSFGAAFTLPSGGTLSLLSEPVFWVEAAGLALVASAESLLCATAVDKLHGGVRTDYDKELRAQGVGNLVCGVVGALPMTGVIVRSSANVAAGAKTKYSAILHGVWLLVLVAAFPSLLSLIPTAALAGVLVHVGFKLLNPLTIQTLAKFGKAQVAIYAATVVAIVTTDLLNGVILGIALSIAHLVYRTVRLDVDVHDDDEIRLRVEGKATFLTLPRLAHTLESHQTTPEVELDLTAVQYLDHAIEDLVDGWRAQRQAAGLATRVVWGHHEPVVAGK